jgi:acyl CoA:acetate/3-ketoacid CoA transferase beta subunit
MVLTEVSPESSVEEIRERTEADFAVSDNLIPWSRQNPDITDLK